MQNFSNYMIFLITGIVTGSLLSWLIMKKRSSLLKESTNKQITAFEKEAVIMKDNIASKEKHINTLSASLSEKDEDIRNLRLKVDEQQEDIERMNERLKIEFQNLVKMILDEKNRSLQTNGDFERQ